MQWLAVALRRRHSCSRAPRPRTWACCSRCATWRRSRRCCSSRAACWGVDLLDVCRRGPAERLALPEHSHPVSPDQHPVGPKRRVKPGSAMGHCSVEGKSKMIDCSTCRVHCTTTDADDLLKRPISESSLPFRLSRPTLTHTSLDHRRRCSSRAWRRWSACGGSRAWQRCRPRPRAPAWTSASSRRWSSPGSWASRMRCASCRSAEPRLPDNAAKPLAAALHSSTRTGQRGCHGPRATCGIWCLMTACAWQVALDWSHHRCGVFVLLCSAAARFTCCYAVHCW